MKTIFGMKIAVSHHVNDAPKIKLRGDLLLSDKFRADFNTYLLDLFGVEPQVIILGDTLYVSPKTYYEFRLIGHH